MAAWVNWNTVRHLLWFFICKLELSHENKIRNEKNESDTCSPAPTIATRLELNSISTMLNAPTTAKKCD